MILLVVPVTVIVAVIRLRRSTGRREARRRLEAVPSAIDLVVACIRAGGTPHDAVHVLIDHGPEPLERDMLLVSGRLAAGDRLIDALRDCASDLSPLFDVLSAGERLGVPLESLLFQLSVNARAARRRSDEEAARRLPVRLSLPLVMCTLPSFVLLVIAPVVIGALSRLQH